MQPVHAQNMQQGSQAAGSNTAAHTVQLMERTVSHDGVAKTETYAVVGKAEEAATSAEGGEGAEGHGEHTGYAPPAPFVVPFGGVTVHLNTLISTWIVMVLLIAMAFVARGSLKKKPDSKQMLFESLVDLPHFVIKSQIAKDTTKYVPLIGSIFLFILFSNWLGLIPWKALELFHTPEGFEMASPTNDLNTNGALALVALASYWFFGISKKGLSHFKHYFSPMWFLFPLNMMEDVSRPLSLTFRLFGNILGGEIVIGILLFLTSSYVVTSVVTLPMFALEVLVGFIQAFIFAMLTASYIGGMVAEHH